MSLLFDMAKGETAGSLGLDVQVDEVRAGRAKDGESAIREREQWWRTKDEGWWRMNDQITTIIMEAAGRFKGKKHEQTAKRYHQYMLYYVISILAVHRRYFYVRTCARELVPNAFHSMHIWSYSTSTCSRFVCRTTSLRCFGLLVVSYW